MTLCNGGSYWSAVRGNATGYCCGIGLVEMDQILDNIEMAKFGSVVKRSCIFFVFGLRVNE